MTAGTTIILKHGFDKKISDVIELNIEYQDFYNCVKNSKILKSLRDLYAFFRSRDSYETYSKKEY